MRAPRAAQQRRRPDRGASCPSTTAPRCSCKAADLLAGPWRETLNAATMLGQSKTAYQAEIDAACELIDFWRFNVHFARQILAEQPIASPGDVEPLGSPPARGVRLRRHAVQLHRDRRQPADRAGAHGQHRGVEARPDPAVRRRTTSWRLLRGGRAPARRHQHGHRRRQRRLRRRARRTPTLPACTSPAPPRVFQLIWRPDRREHRRLPLLPADRRRDRRQGLRHRAPVGRPRRAADGAGARRLRVPGPEVLGGVARLRAAQSSGPDCATTWPPTSTPCDGRVTDFSNFMGAVIDDRAFGRLAGSSTGRRGPDVDRGLGRRDRTTTAKATSSGPPSSSAPTPTDEIFSDRVLRPDPVGPRLRRRRLRRRCGQMESASPVRADRSRSSPRTGAASPRRCEVLRFAAGNFYVNDKPTGAVVGQQPFGGGAGLRDERQGRARRRTCCGGRRPRSIKETFVPPRPRATRIRADRDR